MHPGSPEGPDVLRPENSVTNPGLIPGTGDRALLTSSALASVEFVWLLLLPDLAPSQVNVVCVQQGAVDLDSRSIPAHVVLTDPVALVYHLQETSADPWTVLVLCDQPLSHTRGNGGSVPAGLDPVDPNTASVSASC